MIQGTLFFENDSLTPFEGQSDLWALFAGQVIRDSLIRMTQRGIHVSDALTVKRFVKKKNVQFWNFFKAKFVNVYKLSHT